MATNDNRGSNKNNEQASRTGSEAEDRRNHKLPDDDRQTDERVSTAGDTSNPKYSKTDVRKEGKESRDNSDHNK